MINIKLDGIVYKQAPNIEAAKAILYSMGFNDGLEKIKAGGKFWLADKQGITQVELPVVRSIV